MTKTQPDPARISPQGPAEHCLFLTETLPSHAQLLPITLKATFPG